MVLRLSLIALATLFLSAGQALAETWTNVVGHSIQARLVETNGTMVVFESPDGKRFRMALKSLSVPDRDRIMARLKSAGALPAAERKEDPLVAMIERARKLYADGQITREEFEKVLAGVRHLAEK